MIDSGYIGKRVRIKKAGHYKKRYKSILGAVGVIRSIWSTDNLGVEIDGVENEASKYGYFYFKLSEIELIDDENDKTKNDEGENEMNKVENYLNVAVVQFMDGGNPNTYEYANFEPDLAAGDCCIVMTAHHGMSLARVVEMRASTEAALYREIVAKFDLAPYEARCEKRKKAAELKAKMRERAKQLQDIGLYHILARDDQAMAQLLQDYLEVANG